MTPGVYHLFGWLSLLREPQKLEVCMEVHRLVIKCADYVSASEVWSLRHCLSTEEVSAECQQLEVYVDDTLLAMLLF